MHLIVWFKSVGLHSITNKHLLKNKKIKQMRIHYHNQWKKDFVQKLTIRNGGIYNDVSNSSESPSPVQ